ncbi:nucleotidyltransferase family protein [Microbacterium sp. SS28]|uniref:nucleotidyltransferase family protein n=1 Tax=Microbacterium sp. SS28 TaxID=2919948 RepID=UPI0035B2BD78
MLGSPSLLGLDEAVDLGHAWVQHVAAERGIRVIFIKGPSLQHHGLREPRRSSDVDVLVDPARFEELCNVIESAGWGERSLLFITERTTRHSRTYVRDGWPCDLDVHSYFPGFLAQPSVVFEQLWDRKAQMDCAHRACTIPDRVGSILILGLHSLRGAKADPRHRRELVELGKLTLTEYERGEVATLAVATGSSETLRDVLSALGVPLDVSIDQRSSKQLREWNEWVSFESYGPYFWILALRHARWFEKPIVAWRSIWPTRHDLVLARPEVVDTPGGRLVARVLRLGRGFRSGIAGIRAKSESGSRSSWGFKYALGGRRKVQSAFSHPAFSARHEN